MQDQQFRWLFESHAYDVFAGAYRNATGLSLALIPAGKGVAGFRESSRRETKLCSILRHLPSHRTHCAHCWRGLVNCAVEAKCLRTAKCSTGMVDAAMPLFNDGQHLATLLAGKVIHHRRTLEDWLRNEQIAAKCDPQVLREIITACQTVPVIPAARFRAACVLLEFSARTLEERIPKWLLSSSTELPLSVNKAREFMHAHATERITLPQVARRAGLSVQHFCEIFKRHTGMTFTQCLALERIERAKSLLQNEGIQVAEAAFACGFESISSFNRAFKRLTGATPTQYRLSALDMKRQLRERENT